MDIKPAEAGMSAERLEWITDHLERRYIEPGKIPGCQVVVARHGHVAYFRSLGLMDRERHKPMRDDTIFRIYSMTKPIASVALMTLYEQGYFQLDDEASAYIPEFADLKVFASGDAEQYEVRDPAREMTVRDLLMHTSGLVGAGPGPVGQLYRKAGLRGGSARTLSDMIAKVGKLPLYCDPGSEWNYGISTDVVGYLCEGDLGHAL